MSFWVARPLLTKILATPIHGSISGKIQHSMWGALPIRTRQINGVGIEKKTNLHLTVFLPGLPKAPRRLKSGPVAAASNQFGLILRVFCIGWPSGVYVSSLYATICKTAEWLHTSATTSVYGFPLQDNFNLRYFWVAKTIMIGESSTAWVETRVE